MSDTSKWIYDKFFFFKNDFKRSEIIDQNYSQCFQDLFVLSALSGKSHGTYLEIGAMHPVFNNNTFLLESLFNWTGVSVDFDPSCYSQWLEKRPKSHLLLADALAIPYAETLPLWYGNASRIDYLQLDIDPSFNTLNVLKKLPLDVTRFSVITFETDAYTGDLRARDESRKIFSNYGYELVGMDICVEWASLSKEPIPFEDWWIDPEFVSKEFIANASKSLNLPLLPHHLLFE